MSDLAPILERERRALLDLTARNRLLNTPRRGRRAATVAIVGQSSAELFEALVRERAVMGFRPRAASAGDVGSSVPEDDPFAALAPPEEFESDGRAEERHDLWLQTELPPERLQSRLFRLHYGARSCHEERGINALYLALGFLEWYETPEAEEPRFAPLILVPACLERANALERFRITCADEEIVGNASLIEKLKIGFGLDLPEPDADRLDPAAYLARAERAVRREPRFRVHRDDAVLGLFSFAGLLMYRDLDPANWPADMALEERPLLRALLAEGFRDQPEGVPDEASLDDVVGPHEAAHVLDADSSQSIAIEEVRRGRDLLIQGPPGTGKSQTIVNLIAQAVRDGRTVLFVAQKMAALEVVKRRLDEAGLGHVALELHGRKGSRAEVLAELRCTLEFVPPQPREVERVAGKLGAVRERLNRYARALHAPLEPSGITAYEAIGNLVRLGRRGVAQATFTLPAVESWNTEGLRRRRARVEELADRVVEIGPPARHPWRGVGLLAALPGDLVRIGALTVRLLRSLAGLRDGTELLRRELGLGAMSTLAEMAGLLDICRYLATAPAAVDALALLDPVWRTDRETIAEIVRLGEIQRSHRARLAELCTDVAWIAEIEACHRDLTRHGRSWLRMLHGDWRRARRELATLTMGPPPRSLNERLGLLDALLETQEADRFLAVHDGLGAKAFGRLWQGIESDWPALAAIEHWESVSREQNRVPGAPALLGRVADRDRMAGLASQLTRLIDAIKGCCRELFGQLELDLVEAFGTAGIERVPLNDIESRLQAWPRQLEGLQRWMAYRRLARAALDDGLAPLVERLHDGRLKPARAIDAFDIAAHQPLLRRAVREYPWLGTFDGRSHEQLIARFAELDRERIELARAEIALAHHRRLPRAGNAAGQLGVLRRELSKRRRHLPIRRLLARAGGAVQAIKPVLLMSPLSVAEFLEPGALRFDLLLIDEASQIEAASALGAIARAERMVVVGDDRQLPPTPFFRGTVADEAGDDVGTDDVGDDGDAESASALESILGLCATRGMPQRTLRWHYRSRHPSLIALSNRELYDGRLHVAPSPVKDDPELGLGFHHVPDGVYDGGGTRANSIEAEAVARAVVEHARRRPGLSLGVGCFSMAQRNAILGALERLRRSAPEPRPFFEPDRPEPLFVKNLENLQGDERDVIFVSVGYARNPSGHLATTFGPLAAEGGERRLNVLITRARRRLEVFSSITADDVDRAPAGRPGVAAFKAFLRYAQTGVLEPAGPDERLADPPFEEQVASALAGLGHEVQSRIGTGGFLVDLAIRDPERPARYLLGIECDGAAWHGARSATDRDRLRQQVLEDRGWIVHRIWSADWYRQPERELARVEAAIDEARAVWAARDRAVRRTAPEAASDARQASPASAREPEIGAEIDAIGVLGVPYEEAEIALPDDMEPDLLPPEAMVHAVRRVVEIEGPVHEDEIARRIARAGGRERAGRRMAAAVERGLAEAQHSGLIACDGGFWRPAGRDEPQARDRSKVRSATLRRPDMIPPSEIRAAAMRVFIHAELDALPADIVSRVGRMLGLRTASSGLRAAIEAEIDRLVGERRVVGRSAGTIEERRASAA